MLDILVEISNFSRHGADELGLVGRQVRKILGPFRVLDLGRVLVRAK